MPHNRHVRMLNVKFFKSIRTNKKESSWSSTREFHFVWSKNRVKCLVKAILKKHGTCLEFLLLRIHIQPPANIPSGRFSKEIHWSIVACCNSVGGESVQSEGKFTNTRLFCQAQVIHHFSFKLLTEHTAEVEAEVFVKNSFPYFYIPLF